MRPRFYLFEGGEEFGQQIVATCEANGVARVGRPGDADFAVAPRLQRILRPSEFSAPRLGTLIFHPSVLPYHRGPDAVRWAVHLNERVSGVTWFWCADGIDNGGICEQEAVLLRPGESAGRAYHGRFIPAGLRAFERSLAGIISGMPRSVAQDESLASYESFFSKN